MYPVGLGYTEVSKRLDTLVKNNHHAEALLAAVFALEKTIRRSLRFCILNRGFSSKQADTLLHNKGFEDLKKLWGIFEKTNLALPEFIGQSDWQHIPEAVKMRNKMVHGGRVYKLEDCRERTVQVRKAMEALRKRAISELGCDPWTTLPGRQRSKMEWLNIPQPKKNSS